MSALTIAAAIALAGCSAGSAGSEGTGMPGMNHGSSGTPAGSAPAAASFNEADAAFARMMVAHHAQAVEMPDLLLAKEGIRAAETGLATRSKASQALHWGFSLAGP